MGVYKLPENVQKISLYIDKEVKKKIEEIAKEESRSLNNLINCLIKERIKDAETK